MNIFENRIKPQLKGKTSFGNIEPQTLVDSAEQIGEKLSKEGLNNNQLRKFYDAVKQIERHTLRQPSGAKLSKEVIAQLLFLRPHLANAQRKDNSVKGLCAALDPCLASNVIQTKADLTRFVKFFESIVAYAK